MRYTESEHERLLLLSLGHGKTAVKREISDNLDCCSQGQMSTKYPCKTLQHVKLVLVSALLKGENRTGELFHTVTVYTSCHCSPFHVNSVDLVIG